ncbi:cytochrome C peroxidase [Bradyrhizobium jicamae]|uniref:Cytochrome C peroxidase n=1 Tax=Bradyrhizobium jicamae TaxID=280332 RepID=A0A0R3LXN4_9BRAD|nr:cytochrome c peroxidase [Bradyrhizobium jicamae]KRR10463.1 cytochrome C peroxidase [Bradyrhizobium jicamae]
MAFSRRCAVAICTAIFSSMQLSPAPPKLANHSREPGVTTAQEPVTPVPDAVITDAPKVRIGERLFGDYRLSHDNSRSCASCHDLRTNGAGVASHDVGLDGSSLPLNTPTIFNATLNFRLGWEGKLRTLEADIKASLENPQIMGTSIPEVLGKLNRDPGLRREFTLAYGRGPDAANVLDAIASFERTLVTPGSRFDRWLAGDAAALSAEELDGYRLFKSLGCASCHQGVSIGGNLFQRHGIFRPLASPQPEVLRVPGLRNVATTPPYFHDGSAPTLDDAVRKMGAAQLNSTLTDQQVSAIVAYLQTLTGRYRGTLVGASR